MRLLFFVGVFVLFKSSTDQFELAGPIKEPFRSSFVAGNLSREEARSYFLEYVLPSCQLPPGANEAWERVYEVCGGNPGLLGTCAFEVAKFNSWELGARRHLPLPCFCCLAHLGRPAGCNAIVQTAMRSISRGLVPETWSGAAWSAEDFRTVLRMIVSSPHVAVPVEQLKAVLGEGGAAKLESMNAKNLLLRRAYDPLGRDIDAAVFGPDVEDVYTLPSAAHVLAARLELDLEQ